MKNLAFLFPGQGAQYPQMGKDFFETFPIARQTFEEADDLLHTSLSKIIFEGTEEELTETRISQTAIFVNSMAIMRVLQDQISDLTPSVCAGLSLGEYSALCASQKITFADCIKLVMQRGQFLNEACVETKGAMSAVLGLNAPEIEEIIRSLNPPHQIWVANFNCPGQTVISGTIDAVQIATEALKAKGAKRIIPLQVYGAFHSGLMMSAQKKLAPLIAGANISESSIALVMNVPGNYVEQSDQVKDFLTRQVTHSVRWEQGVRAMMNRGVKLFVEIGCGKTLTGMNRKIGAETAISIDKVADLDEAARQMESGSKV